MATKTPQRHPGRRKAASTATIKKHEKLLKEALKKKEKAEAEVEKARNLIAQRADAATQANVETNFIGNVLGVSRQMVYKTIRERVDQKPLSKASPPSRNGSGPSKKSTTKKGNAFAKGKKAK